MHENRGGGREAAAARLAEKFTLGNAKCAVVGLGFIGSAIMDALRAAGIEAHGHDRAPEAAARYAARASQPEPGPAPWSVGSDPAICADSDVVYAAIRLPVDAGGIAQLEPLDAVADLLRGARATPRLVLLASTVPPGTTRNFAGLLDPSVTFVAHVPERIAVGQDWRGLRETPHLVGGLDPLATDLAARFLGRFCATVHPVSSPEVSELSKLLENAFLSQGIALVGEVTRIAHAIGISAAEVCNAAATKKQGYFPFHPGFGVGGHCLPNDLRLLRAASRVAGGESTLIAAVEESLETHGEIVVERLEEVMRHEQVALHGARILLVGVGFKIGSPDISATPSREIVRLLRTRGAQVRYQDSRVERLEVDGEAVPRVTADDIVAPFDAALVLAGQPELAIEELRLRARIVLDTGGARIMPGDRNGLHNM